MNAKLAKEMRKVSHVKPTAAQKYLKKKHSNGKITVVMDPESPRAKYQQLKKSVLETKRAANGLEELHSN